MRLLYLFLISSLFIGCKTSQISSKQPSAIKSINWLSGCMEESACEAEIMGNKKMILLKDEVSNQIYPQFVADSSKQIIKLTSRINADKMHLDQHYFEDIYIELPNKYYPIKAINIELLQYKVLLHKSCYCRGEAGYYAIRNGELKINQKNLILSFDVPETNIRLNSIQIEFDSNH
ncbi:hypothetical protein [Mesonia sp. HuA40]|uniref:hypothetical protein n=1 Tax=Mesonia sp. HuA40 TaxID=2602761 RepID=UPI0011C8E84B|nr:hypothetical protein [Mesonia sp. HuA40]TXK71034.1 hypothetical protein FT993_10665 [Mesonia sp. HuA40]